MFWANITYCQGSKSKDLNKGLCLLSVPCVNCSSELHGGAGFDRQVLVQRSDSHIGWYVERGGSPSGSRKGFMDKTRVISLSDSNLEKKMEISLQRT